MIMKRKSQAWSLDYIIAALIFVSTFILSIKFITEITVNQGSDPLKRDIMFVSESLISEGYPPDWDNESVIRIGLTNNFRLNTTKLQRYEDIDYYASKGLLVTRYDYYFFFRNSTDIINVSKCGYGYNLTVDANCNPDLSSVSYDDLVKIDRLLIYNHSPIIMEVWMWR